MIKIGMLLLVWAFQTSIYTYKIPDVKGDTIDLNNFRDKKILLVNIATQSRYAAQLEKLEELHNLYKDSLVIIAFPSNSFGHEPGANAGIETICRQQYGAHFLIVAKNSVKGADAQPVYQWLAQYGKNGVTDITIPDDFEKILLSREGKLMGIFGPSVDPMSKRLREAVQLQQ